MPSMIAIILLIILHIWLCRQGGDHFWSESRLNISLLMLDIEHLARGKNGFTVTGESACASPENFDAEIGRKIARQNAVNKIWMLEGYLLKQKLSEQ